MKKLLIVVLIIALLFTFAGCIHRTDPIDSQIGGGDSDHGTPSNPGDTPFAVQLVTYDNSTLPDTSQISVKWTSKDAKTVYTSSFDENGLAYSYKPDGEYYVTLVGEFSKYAYNPNIYTADNDNKTTTIILYPLQIAAGGAGDDAYEQAIQIRTMGVHRFTFSEPNEVLFFTFTTSNGGYIYSIESFLDTTLDEVSPILTRRSPVTAEHVMETIVGGGASGKFTQNFKYSISTQKNSGATYLFAISLQCTANAKFPITMDVLISNTGEEYQNPWDAVVAEVPEYIPTLEEINATPVGAFQAFADFNNKVLDQSKVRMCDDGYYHYDSNADGQIDTSDDFLYIKLSGQITGLYETYNGMGLLDPRESVRCYDQNGVYTSYKELVTAYSKISSYYPVNQQLHDFLVCFAKSKGYFSDGFGFSEQEGYDYVSGGDDRWLFICGVFI